MMASDVAMKRKYASNVGFLTEDGDIFAGVYLPELPPDGDDAQDADGHKLTYREALGWIRQSFHLEMSHQIGDGDPGDELAWAWAFMPRIGVLYDMARRDKPWPGEVKEALSLDVPVRRGLYYLVKHRVRCSKGLDIDGSYRCGMEHLVADCTVRVRSAAPRPPPATTGPSPPRSSRPTGSAETAAAMAAFHRTDPHADRRCAITGRRAGDGDGDGDDLAAPGPVVAHIVPAEHHDVYPLRGSDHDDDDDDDGGYSPADRWDMTWDARFNGVALLPGLEAAWRDRLVAVEPETLTVHAFAPGPAAPHHGRPARPAPAGAGGPDVEALRWHYRMCVYENITGRLLGGVGAPPGRASRDGTPGGGGGVGGGVGSRKRKRVQWWNRGQGSRRKRARTTGGC